MTFQRLNRWGWMAFVAALAPLFVMASDYARAAGRRFDPSALPTREEPSA